jgi:endonuclease/exonuclease/phosphatase family metal-dependent hydrolase
VDCFQSRKIIFAALSALAIAAAPASKSCEPLRVMTYNIRLDLESDGINRWSVRRDQFIGQLQLMKPAILGLQEVVRGQQADLERALPTYSFLGLPREAGPMGESSNVVFDRTIFSLKSNGTFWLSPTPSIPSKGWDAAYSRTATWAHLVRRSDGRRFLAVNTHLDNEGQVARLEGAKQILRWISANKGPGEAIVVTGDFNTEPGTPPIREMTHSALGLRDAHEATRSIPVGPEGTWNDFQTLPKESSRIDFVFVDPKLVVDRYAVLAWHYEGGRPASDHFPVVADLSNCR